MKSNRDVVVLCEPRQNQGALPRKPESPHLNPEALGLLSDIRVFSLPEEQYFQQPQVPLFSALYSEWDFCCNYSFHGQH